MTPEKRQAALEAVRVVFLRAQWRPIETHPAPTLWLAPDCEIEHDGVEAYRVWPARLHGGYWTHREWSAVAKALDILNGATK